MYGYVGLCRAVYSYVGLCRAMYGYMYCYVGLCTLVPMKQRVLYKVCEFSTEVCNADTKTLDAALAVIQVSASSKHETAKSRCDKAKQSSFNNLPSSVQECMPSKKAVSDCIVKECDGTVSFEVISKRQDLFPNIVGTLPSGLRQESKPF